MIRVFNVSGIVVLLMFMSCGELGKKEVSDVGQESEQVETFPLSNVALLDGPFKHANELGERTLLDYEPNSFLSNFRKEAGLEPKAENYKGWEAESLAGHSLGHYLSACTLMYQTTGNKEFLKRVNYIVDELAVCQETDGDGYIGAFENGKKIFEEEVAKGEIRSQGFDLNGIWAPFYTHHKVLAGLRDAYRLTGNKKALIVGKKFADWIYTIVSPLNDEQVQEMLHCEHGGMNEVLVDLYDDTNDSKYLDMANIFYHKAVLDPLVRQEDSLAGIHANTQFPKVIGLVKRYNSTGNQNDYRAATFFWDRVVNHHSYVTGGNANHEYFGKPDHLAMRLSDESTETCNVYNMLKLSSMLFQEKPNAALADYYERGLFNQILSSQHPESGHVIYNLSLEMGGYKQYEDPFGFTCCVGTGMENHAKYGKNIYYHDKHNLFVSQYIASELSWKEEGLSLVQKTDYPNEQGTKLQFGLKAAKEITLHVRYPYWAEKGMKIKVNGEAYDFEATPSSFVPIHRTWEDGDVVELSLPFTLRLETMPDANTRAAFMYGPLVLAGDLGEVDNPKAKDEGFVPVFFTDDKNPSALLEKIADENHFITKEGVLDKQIELYPFYRTHDVRYTVYWDIYTEEEWKNKLKAYDEEKAAYDELVRNTFDFFQPGEMQPERNHHYKGEDTHVVQMKGRKARQSERGGWFSFDIKVPKGSSALVFEYWGGYTGSKTFDILVDGTKIATQNISGMKDGSFTTVHYSIPTNLTEGKDKVTVKIAPHTGHRGGPLFGARTVSQ